MDVLGPLGVVFKKGSLLQFSGAPKARPAEATRRDLGRGNGIT